MNKKMDLLKTSALVIASSLIFFPGATAQTQNLITDVDTQIQSELEELGPIYQVIAPNAELATKAAITFHGNLLETITEQNIHIMTLSTAEAITLKTLGFTVNDEHDFPQRYKQHRLGQMAAADEKIANAFTAQQMTGIPGYFCYPTVEETYAKMDMMVSDDPSLASIIDIGDSWKKSTGGGGYDLRVLKITNSAITGDKPKLFIHSAMHAREYTTAALSLDFADRLLRRYGLDADPTWIVDNHEIHILFHMNPDGRKQAETGLLWRKNVNENYCGVNSNSRGADLNRNFTHSWNSTNGQGSSGNVCSTTYRGPSAASEPETQALETYLRDIFPDSRGPNVSDAAPSDTQGLHLDIHSYSELILWPWGDTNSVAPNGTALQTLGRKLAFWNGYQPTQSIGLYATDGTSDAISYGELGIPSITYELGTAFFQSCNDYQTTVRPDNLPSLEYAAKIVRAPYLLPSGPEVHDVTINGSKDGYASFGDQVELRATASDNRFEDQNGVEPSQKVIEAEYYVNSYPWQAGATGIPMAADDAAFSAKSEAITAMIETTNLNSGRNMIFIRAKDNQGNWGAGSAGFLILPLRLNQPPENRWWSRCDGLTCEFFANQSTDSDGEIVSYYWKFESGTPGVFGRNATHTFSSAGTYRPLLTVKDDDGAKTKKRRRLVVQ